MNQTKTIIYLEYDDRGNLKRKCEWGNPEYEELQYDIL